MKMLKSRIALAERAAAGHRIMQRCKACGHEAWVEASDLVDAEGSDGRMALDALEGSVGCPSCGQAGQQWLNPEHGTVGAAIDRALVVVLHCRRCDEVSRMHPVRLLMMHNVKRDDTLREAVSRTGCRNPRCGSRVAKLEAEALDQDAAIGMEGQRHARRARAGDRVRLTRVEPPHERLEWALDAECTVDDIATVERGDPLFERLEGRLLEEELEIEGRHGKERYAITEIARLLG